MESDLADLLAGRELSKKRAKKQSEKEMCIKRLVDEYDSTNIDLFMSGMANILADRL